MINFDVKFLKDVDVFLEVIEPKAREKLINNIKRAKITNDPSIFKKLKGTEIWEFRARFQGMQYRLFAFWDKNKKALVVCTHGLIKKTQKVRKVDIEKAERIRKEYLENNLKNNNNKEPSNHLEL